MIEGKSSHFGYHTCTHAHTPKLSHVHDYYNSL